MIREAIALDSKCDFAYETLATLEVQMYVLLLCSKMGVDTQGWGRDMHGVRGTEAVEGKKAKEYWREKKCPQKGKSRSLVDSSRLIFAEQVDLYKYGFVIIMGFIKEYSLFLNRQSQYRVR